MKQNWSLTKKWRIGVILLIILYILTIPVRDYSFLNVEGVTVWMHLLIILGLVVFYSILLFIFDKILKFILRKV